MSVRERAVSIESGGLRPSDRMGELSWHGQSDLYRFAMLIIAGAIGLLAGGSRRWSSRRTRPVNPTRWQALSAKPDEEETRGG